MFVTEAVDRIEAILDELARAQGYGLGRSSRYRPIRGTAFIDQRKRFVGGDRPPQNLMTWEMFEEVRKCLVEDAERALGRERARDIDIALTAAWERDSKTALTAPGEIPKRWDALKKTYDITTARTDHPTNFYWLLYDLLYAPMLVEDRKTFYANNDAIKAALANRDPAFRQDETGYYKAWALYASLAGFCMHRLMDPRHRAYMVFLNRIFAQTRLPILKAELLTHSYYLRNLSRNSARAFEITQSDAMAEEWSVLRAYDVGRAASTYLLNGMALDGQPKEFGGKTVLCMLEKFDDFLLQHGHHVQSKIFRIVHLWPVAGAGDVDRVYVETEKLTQENSVVKQGIALGRCAHIDRLVAVVRARAHFAASRGRDGHHLVEAHGLVQKFAAYYERLDCGETKLARDVLTRYQQVQSEKQKAA